MKTIVSLILASLVLITSQAYAEKAPQQSRAKATPRVVRNKPANPPVSTQNSNGQRSTQPSKVNGSHDSPPNNSSCAKGFCVDIPVDSWVKGPRDGNAGAARTANPNSTTPTTAPEAFQALTKNEKVKTAESAPEANPK